MKQPWQMRVIDSHESTPKFDVNKSKATKLWKYVHYTIRMFPPAIDIIPTLLAVVYSNGKYTN